MRATVGIVAYATPVDDLRRTMESIARQEFDGELELVVLCNSAVAGYQDTVAALAREFGFKLLDWRPNRGFGAGHNEIIRETSGPASDWYVCCNPDIVASPDVISKLVRYGISHDDAVLLAPKVLNLDGTLQKNARQLVTLPRWLRRQLWRIAGGGPRPYEEAFNYGRSQPVEFVSGCFFAVQRGKFDRLNGFDDSFFLYFEDADLSFRATAIGTNYYVAEAVIVHKWEKAWRRSWRAIAIQSRAMVRYFAKNGLGLNRHELSP
jgi:GT2 family glycosyltransferase